MMQMSQILRRILHPGSQSESRPVSHECVRLYAGQNGALSTKHIPKDQRPARGLCMEPRPFGRLQRHNLSHGNRWRKLFLFMQ